MGDAATALKGSISDIEGFTIQGKEVKPDNELFPVFLESIYFISLIIQIANKLVDKSYFRVADEKKLEEPQGDTLAG